MPCAEVVDFARTGALVIEEHRGHVFEQDEKASALSYTKMQSISTSEVDWGD